MYDVNNDKSIDVEEVLSVYSDIFVVNTGITAAGLNPVQEQKVRSFFKQADKNSTGGLDYAEFANAVKLLHTTSGGGTKQPFLTPINMYMVFVTAFFELGTSLSLPAMGALSVQMQNRFDIGDADIGALVSWYYCGSMFGPLFGGQLLIKFGAARTIILANSIVACGAFLQAFADGPDQFSLLCVSRFVIGFGGLITPFTTLEVLCRLFPDDFMLMAGIRNLIQSASGFMAFMLLPYLQNADNYNNCPSKERYNQIMGFENSTAATAPQGANGDACYGKEYNDATTTALYACLVCTILSLTSNIIIYAQFLSGDSKPKPPTLASQLRAFSGAITPQSPSSWAQWKLPLSFYLACYGIQAQYFAPFAFTAFSMKIYTVKFGATASSAAFLSGVMNVMGGCLGPILGPVSDKFGKRALMLGGFGIPTILAFILLATTSVEVGDINESVLWMATIGFAWTYGFGDTVAYPNIRLLVGADRAGIGYGIFGFIGGVVAVAVPAIAGVVMEAYDDPLDPTTFGNACCWCFAVMEILATLAWTAVHFMEGPKAAVNLPADDLIETTDSEINAASLVSIE